MSAGDATAPLATGPITRLNEQVPHSNPTPRVGRIAAVVGQLDALAADVGRLRRSLGSSSSYSDLLVDRIAERVETLDVMLSPTAADIYTANLLTGALEDEAVEAAIADAGARARRLRVLLGEETRDDA